jgi:hypothetical protein
MSQLGSGELIVTERGIESEAITISADNAPILLDRDPSLSTAPLACLRLLYKISRELDKRRPAS